MTYSPRTTSTHVKSYTKYKKDAGKDKPTNVANQGSII